MTRFARSLFGFGSKDSLRSREDPNVATEKQETDNGTHSETETQPDLKAETQTQNQNGGQTGQSQRTSPANSHGSSQSQASIARQFSPGRITPSTATTALTSDGFVPSLGATLGIALGSGRVNPSDGLVGRVTRPNDKNQSLRHSQTNITSSQGHSNHQKSTNGMNNYPQQGSSDPLTTPPHIAPNGRLTVKIVEAKDLRVSISNPSPYVVCTFESSEFITHGPSLMTTSKPETRGKNSVPLFVSGIAPIPMKSKQSSSLALNTLAELAGNINGTTNPKWKHETTFDVISDESELDLIMYDKNADDAFLGHVRISPLFVNERISKEWYDLQPRVPGERVSGKIKVEYIYNRISKKHYGPDDFEILRLLGKGTFGQVYQVRKRDTGRIYAMKVLSKKVIVKKKEIAHTIGERDILVTTASTGSPFIVGLKFSFQTPTDLYLVTDYMSGGELFWHLQKEGRFNEERAKFYIAELVMALEQLHNNDIVYRDLKPENILLDANGHIALCDFGLSKANLTSNGTTNTFCGTTEYLAPEVLLDENGYTKMVDFWSLGVLIFEMCCGWSPFYAENTNDMYKNIAFGKVRFPKDVLSQEGKAFVKGLLNRNPKHRLGAIDDARELRQHPFFNDIDWDLLLAKNLPPPFKPHLTSETDTSNFDPEFTQTSSSVIHRNFLDSTPLSPGIQANFQGFTYVGESSMDDHFRTLHDTNILPGANNGLYDNAIDDDDDDDKDSMDIDNNDDDVNGDYFLNGQRFEM